MLFSSSFQLPTFIHQRPSSVSHTSSFLILSTSKSCHFPPQDASIPDRIHTTHKLSTVDANAHEQIPSRPAPLSLLATSYTFPFLYLLAPTDDTTHHAYELTVAHTIFRIISKLMYVIFVLARGQRKQLFGVRISVPTFSSFCVSSLSSLSQSACHIMEQPSTSTSGSSFRLFGAAFIEPSLSVRFDSVSLR